MSQTVAFAVDSPEDLSILADWLADQRRSGEVLVRWLARWQRWPTTEHLSGPKKKFSWFPIPEEMFRRRMCSVGNEMIPSLVALTDSHWEWFDTPSEAIWTLIERYEQNPVILPEE